MVGTGFDSRGLFAEYRGPFQSNPTLSSTKNVFKIKIPVSKTTISAHKTANSSPGLFELPVLFVFRIQQSAYGL
jgi:hypothetical protein